MSKRANLPYTYQDLFPHTSNSPRELRTPGSISGASFSESFPRIGRRSSSSAFVPSRTSSRNDRLGNWKKLLKRLFKPNTLDFETATWEVFHLIVNPKKMHRSIYTYRQQNNRGSSYARDDPSFLILLTGLLSILAVAWGLAYSPHIWDIVKLLFNMVLVDFYLNGVIVASLSWLLVNMLVNRLFSILRVFSMSSTYGVNYVDWGFCFDVHCNGFLMIWLLLYLLQFFLLPLISNKKSSISLILGNSLYFGAVAHYLVITFYGFNALPFLNSTSYARPGSQHSPAKILQVILVAVMIPLLAVWWLLTILLQFNVAYTMVDNYFN